MRSFASAFLPCVAFIDPVVRSQLVSTASSPTATIDSGSITGRTTQLPNSDTIVNQFLGIPFAQPPVENLRFSPPQPLQPFEDVYNATSQPNACIQYKGKPGPVRDMTIALLFNPPPPGESEDCLYLNVYAPSGGSRDKAVLFWIYGGSGVAGAASYPLYDGSSFAANQDIVVVAANYRVNVFGQPRAPQLRLEERNVGLLDTRLALDWVQRNIQAFGGDPEKVTIMGESAGAVSVSNLINTYPENPPFRGGVLQSGSSLVKIPPAPLNNDTRQWDALISVLNCTDTSDEGILACARAVPATTLNGILEAAGVSFSEPVQDNVTVLQSPAAAYIAGNVAKVPILIGSTANDGSLFSYSAPPNVTLFIETTFGAGTPISDTLIQFYSPGSPATAGPANASQIISQIVTDSTFRCTSGFVANVTSTLLGAPVWQYVFNASVPSNQWDEYPGLGVYHASEIALQFGTYPRNGSNQVEARLSQSIQKQFADFVKDPQQGPGWSAWPNVGILGVNKTDAVTTTQDVRVLDAVCGPWNQLYALSLASQIGQDAGAGAGGGNGTAPPPGNGTDTPPPGSSADRTAINFADVGVVVLSTLLLGALA